MRGSSIVFVEQFFYPEGWSGADIPRNITHALVDELASVTVLCGSKPYVEPFESPLLGDPRDYGILLQTLFVFGARKNYFLRALNNILFSFQVFLYLLTVKSLSLIIAQTNPPFAMLAVALAGFLRNKPFIVISMDVYPDAFFVSSSQVARIFLAPFLNNIFACAYKQAYAVVSLGSRMSARLQSKGLQSSRIVEIPNWATGNLSIRKLNSNKFLSSWGLQNTFNLLYSGNLGIPHELDTVIHALKLLIPQIPEIRLICVASGSRVPYYINLVDELSLSDYVLFRPLSSYRDLPDTMGLAHLGIVSVNPGFEGIVVPSKLSGLMARGIPVIYTGPPSEVSQIIHSSGGGACFLNGDFDGLAEYILHLFATPFVLREMSVVSLNYYHKHLAAPIGLLKYKNLVFRALGQ